MVVGVPNVTTSALIRNTGGKEREAEKRVRWTMEQRVQTASRSWPRQGENSLQSLEKEQSPADI